MIHRINHSKVTKLTPEDIITLKSFKRKKKSPIISQIKEVMLTHGYKVLNLNLKWEREEYVDKRSLHAILSNS